MVPSKAVKEYKEELAAVNQQNTQLTLIVGKMTVEKEWLAKKLGLSDKRKMIEPVLKTLSLAHQCQLLDISRTFLYYQPSAREKEKIIKE